MKGSVFKRCGCTAVVDGKRKQLGNTCPKLKRPDGAWNPRHGTWYYALSVVGSGGKRSQVIRGGHATSTDAQTALDAAKTKANRGISVTTRIKTGVYLRQALNAKRDIKKTTWNSYSRHVDLYFEPLIGHIWLDELRVSHVADCLAQVGLVDGARGGGAATRQRVRASLRSLLTDAVREELIAVNPAALVKLESGRRPKALVWTAKRERTWRDTGVKPSPVMVWLPHHLGTFLDAVASQRLYGLWWVMAHRGTRRGETCGLAWSGVDLSGRTADITRQLVSTDGEVYEDTPKSDAGDRVISLGKEGVRVLKAHRKRQRAERLAWGAAWVDSGKVFTRDDGSALDPNWVSDEFDRLVTRLGLPPIRLHDLRHGAASLMRAAGVDMKVIQETLGHSSMALTANTYTSVFPDVSAAAADQAARIVPRKSKQAVA